MFALVFPMMLTALAASDDPGSNDFRSLIDTIESLQQPIVDFRCEFEGRIYSKGSSFDPDHKLGADGLYDMFSGVYIWRTGGDTLSDSFHLIHPEKVIRRELLAIRMWEHEAEEYNRLNDAPLGYTVIKDPKVVNANRMGCYGELFVIDELKRHAVSGAMKATLSDDLRDGRRLKVLTLAVKSIPTMWIFRYWIDLRRNGHVVHRENYPAGNVEGNVLEGQADITLASFNAGNTEVWMPVLAKSELRAAMKDGQGYTTKSPTIIETIYVVAGTMELNKRPGREAFTIKYPPGTPVSDSLRQLKYDYGQQRPEKRLSKADAEAALRKHLEAADAQKSDLVTAASSTWQGTDLWSWLPWAFCVAALASISALWFQNRRRGTSHVGS